MSNFEKKFTGYFLSFMSGVFAFLTFVQIAEHIYDSFNILITIILSFVGLRLIWKIDK